MGGLLDWTGSVADYEKHVGRKWKAAYRWFMAADMLALNIQLYRM